LIQQWAGFNPLILKFPTLQTDPVYLPLTALPGPVLNNQTPAFQPVKIFEIQVKPPLNRKASLPV
jgi:hypothetical protein